MARAFTGDYTTGNLKQWDQILSSGPASRASGDYLVSPTNFPASRGDHTVQVVTDDPDAGYACRFELRAADNFASGGDADGMVGSQKAELITYTPLIEPGDTWWHAWSIKFEQFNAWPAARTTSNFLIADEWHSHNTQPAPVGGGTIFWGMPPWTGRIIDEVKGPGSPEGYYTLYVDKYSEGGTDLSTMIGRTLLLNVPINLGNWIDIKMEVKYSPSDTLGYVRCWINNQPQTLLTGGTTYTGRTTLGVTPTTTTEYYYYQPGIYRSGNSISPMPWDDMILHHANYRIADSESSL